MTATFLTDHGSIFVGGEWIRSSSTERIEVVSPYTEEVIASVPSGSRDDVDRAVTAARSALESGPWPAMGLEERLAVLSRLRELLVSNAEELAQLITRRDGMPDHAVSQHSGRQPCSHPRRVSGGSLDIPIPHGASLRVRRCVW